MSVGELNLARRPFLNRRPVLRIAALAWLLGCALLAVNVVLFVRYRRDSTDLRSRLGEVRAQIEDVSGDVLRLSSRLDSLGVGAQNEQVAFLNGRLAERAFPWSLLFERIGETLPRGVRLTTLTPVFARSRRRQSEAAEENETILLNVDGVAENSASIYAFVDSLFAHPAFANPVLHNEDSSPSEVRFRLDVLIDPVRLLPARSKDASPEESG